MLELGHPVPGIEGTLSEEDEWYLLEEKVDAQVDRWYSDITFYVKELQFPEGSSAKSTRHYQKKKNSLHLGC